MNVFLTVPTELDATLVIKLAKSAPNDRKSLVYFNIY